MNREFMGQKKYKWHKVADKESDIRWFPGQVGEVEVEGKKLCIGRFKDELYGFSATCPHAGAPMTDAYITGACHIVCPVHSLRFDLRNGRDVNGEGYSLKVYPVEVRTEGIYLGIEEGGKGLFKWF